jgi:hypothetical protein
VALGCEGVERALASDRNLLTIGLFLR